MKSNYLFADAIANKNCTRVFISRARARAGGEGSESIFARASSVRKKKKNRAEERKEQRDGPIFVGINCDRTTSVAVLY